MILQKSYLNSSEYVEVLLISLVLIVRLVNEFSSEVIDEKYSTKNTIEDDVLLLSNNTISLLQSARKIIDSNDKLPNNTNNYKEVRTPSEFIRDSKYNNLNQSLKRRLD